MPTHLGDCDFDGDVDGSDFLAWQRNVSATGPALSCDFNADGAINNLDLDIWKANVGYPNGIPQ